MNSEHHAAIQAFMDRVAERNPNEPEFLQAVEEVAEAIVPFMEDNPKYKDSNILERIVEPERVIMFRVPWTDDAGNVHTNRGFRIEFNSAIGPYKGGLRFHPTVNLSILKFLGFITLTSFELLTMEVGSQKTSPMHFKRFTTCFDIISE